MISRIYTLLIMLTLSVTPLNAMLKRLTNPQRMLLRIPTRLSSSHASSSQPKEPQIYPYTYTSGKTEHTINSKEEAGPEIHRMIAGVRALQNQLANTPCIKDRSSLLEGHGRTTQCLLLVIANKKHGS